MGRYVVVAALCVGCGGGGAPAVVTVPAATATTLPLPVSDAVDGQKLVEHIAAAERAYEERADPRDILLMLAPGVRIEAGRVETPSPKDSLFSRQRLAAIYTWAAHHESKKTKFTYKDVHVTASGSSASFTWTAMSDTGNGLEQGNWFGQRYELERRGGEWKVVRFRYWPLRPDTGKEFGTAYFADLDKQIDEALATNDTRNATYLMMIAYRFDECARLARTLTDASPTDAWAWDMRARASALVGDLEDAEQASARHDALSGGP